MPIVITDPRLDSCSSAVKPESTTQYLVTTVWSFFNADTKARFTVSVLSEVEPGTVDFDQDWWDDSYGLAKDAALALYPGGDITALDPVVL